MVYVGIAEEEVRSSFDFRSEVEIDEEISLKVFYNQNGCKTSSQMKRRLLKDMMVRGYIKPVVVDAEFGDLYLSE